MFSLSPTTSQFLYRLGEVSLKFCAEKQKDCAKLVNYGAAWTSAALGNDPHDSNSKLVLASGFFRDAKNFLSATEVPGRVKQLVVVVKDCWDKPSCGKAANVFCSALTAAVVPVCDTIDLASKFVPISPVLKAVKVVNYTATLVGTGAGATRKAYEIYTAGKESREENFLRFLYVMNQMSYVALGIIGLCESVPALRFVAELGFVTAPWMLLACATSGLLFGIGGFFYENLVVKANPERQIADLQKEQAKIERQLGKLEQEKRALVGKLEQEKQALAKRLAEEAAAKKNSGPSSSDASSSSSTSEE